MIVLNLSRKLESSEQLSMLGGYHSIHFCTSQEKEAEVLLVIDCTDSLQCKITSFQSNPVAELRRVISAFPSLSMLPFQIGKQYSEVGL